MLRHVLDVLSCGVGSAVSLGSLRSPMDCNRRLRRRSVGSELIDFTFTGYSLCTCSSIDFSLLFSPLMRAQSLSNFTSTGFILSCRMRNTSSDRKKFRPWSRKPLAHSMSVALVAFIIGGKCSCCASGVRRRSIESKPS